MTGGALIDNEAIRDGGAIFTVRHDYQNPITLATAYDNIVIGKNVLFAGNRASISFGTPINAHTFRPSTLKFASTSSHDHILNNSDVNWRFTPTAAMFGRLEAMSDQLTRITGYIVNPYTNITITYVNTAGELVTINQNTTTANGRRMIQWENSFDSELTLRRAFFIELEDDERLAPDEIVTLQVTSTVAAGTHNSHETVIKGVEYGANNMVLTVNELEQITSVAALNQLILERSAAWATGILPAGDLTNTIRVISTTLNLSAIEEGFFTATLEVGNKAYPFSIAIQVVNPIEPVISIAIDQNDFRLLVGNTSQLTATVLPANATNQNVRWSSSNPGVATVDANGVVTAISSGVVTITVMTEDGEHYDTITITVIIDEGLRENGRPVQPKAPNRPGNRPNNKLPETGQGLSSASFIGGLMVTLAAMMVLKKKRIKISEN